MSPSERWTVERIRPYYAKPLDLHDGAFVSQVYEEQMRVVLAALEQAEQANRELLAESMDRLSLLAQAEQARDALADALDEWHTAFPDLTATQAEEEIELLKADVLDGDQLMAQAEQRGRTLEDVRLLWAAFTKEHSTMRYVEFREQMIALLTPPPAEEGEGNE